MLEAPGTFRAIIELWSTRKAMAEEIGAGADMVSKWWRRDAIPAEWWLAIVSAPTAKAAGITAEILAAIAARPSSEAREPAEARA